LSGGYCARACEVGGATAWRAPFENRKAGDRKGDDDGLRRNRFRMKDLCLPP
jgi:hypothetical protein